MDTSTLVALQVVMWTRWIGLNSPLHTLSVGVRENTDHFQKRKK